MNDYGQFEQLIKNGYSCISIISHEEDYALDIVRETAKTTERDMWIWSASQGVRNGLELVGGAPVADTQRADVGLTNLFGSDYNTICVTMDLGLHLRDGRVLRVLRDMIDKFAKNGNILVMIDSTNNLPDVIKSYSRQFELSFPNEEELLSIIKDTLKQIHQKKPIEIGISHEGLHSIVRNLRGLTRRQAQRIISDVVIGDQRFDDNDINQVIASKRQMIQSYGLLEYVQTPLNLDEIGGMRNLKKWLEQRKDAFGKDADDFGLKTPRGILMLGIQGAGKSLTAKAVATAWHQPLLRLDPCVLYDRYIGESERNLRMALRQVEMMSPVILWIDEIEKAFASAASRSADGGLSQRMFGTLLTWLQEHQSPVFVIATANDIEALPPELLRKGRFDEIFFVDLPKEDVRKEIFAIHIKKCKRDPKRFDLKELARISKGYTGSEIEQAVNSALHDAYAGNTDLNDELIIDSIINSPPLSVTMAEKVHNLVTWAKGRFVPAD